MEASVDSAERSFLKRKRGVVWGEQETKYLLKLWERSLDEFSKTKRNRHVHENISRLLASLGVTKTWGEVATKIKNLTNEYRREKTKLLSGENPSPWKLYDQVDRIIGNLPRNDPSLADESCGLEILDGSPLQAEEDPALSSDSDVKIFIRKVPQEPEITIREASSEKQTHSASEMGSSSGRDCRKRRAPIYTDDDDDEEEGDDDFDYKAQYLRLKKENRQLREKVSVLQKKCDINEDVRRTEKNVIVNLQSLNHRLQTQLLNLL